MRRFIFAIAVSGMLCVCGASAQETSKALPDAAKTGQRIDTAQIEPGNCSDLDKLRLINASVGSAVAVVTSGTYFCRVAGVARPTSDSYVNFEIWLPSPSKWNGKLYSNSGGSGLGGIKLDELKKGLARGYASMSSDRGHSGRDDRGASFAGDGTWALGHPEKIIDWSYRGQHVSTVATKEIVAAYYGKPASRAYFESCSAGGHQAVMEAEHYPNDYDGIIAGAAGVRMNYSLTHLLWQKIQGRLSERNKLSNDKLSALHAAAVKKCDPLDGIKDDLIELPLECEFDPAILRCKSDNGPSCLTADQLRTAQKYYSGMQRRNGEPLAQGSGAPPGSEIGWKGNIDSTAPTMVFHFFKYWVYEDPDYDFMEFDFDDDFDRMLRKPLAGKTMGEVLDAKGDLQAFHDQDGKMIMWVGGADHVTPPGVNVAYRDTVARKLSSGNVGDVLRLFIAPGVGHCGGGSGPDQFDMLDALESWVEDDRAPEVVVARKKRTDGSFSRSLPLCPYPSYAKYVGTGDIYKAENYVCDD